ncbi:MAG TPA: hypothetical protein VG757_11220 [Devosia sp.]|nr:hypothetical protein [Devosia sp.]
MSAGLQFTFFLAPSDQAAFDSILRSSGDIAFLRVFSPSPSAQEAPTSVIEAMGKENIKLLIARRADVSKIGLVPVKGRNEFSYDSFSDPIIEFSRCYANDHFIRAGRLYRTDRYWNRAGERISKSPEFIEWASRLYKLARGSLTRVEQGCYAGKGALERRKADVAFEGLDIEVGSIPD